MPATFKGLTGRTVLVDETLVTSVGATPAATCTQQGVSRGARITTGLTFVDVAEELGYVINIITALRIASDVDELAETVDSLFTFTSVPVTKTLNAAGPTVVTEANLSPPIAGAYMAELIGVVKNTDASDS